ncbi:unnamed protein product [Leuciscus chuanchicus]
MAQPIRIKDRNIYTIAVIGRLSEHERRLEPSQAFRKSVRLDRTEEYRIVYSVLFDTQSPLEIAAYLAVDLVTRRGEARDAHRRSQDNLPSGSLSRIPACVCVCVYQLTHSSHTPHTHLQPLSPASHPSDREHERSVCSSLRHLKPVPFTLICGPVSQDRFCWVVFNNTPAHLQVRGSGVESESQSSQPVPFTLICARRAGVTGSVLLGCFQQYASTPAGPGSGVESESQSSQVRAAIETSPVTHLPAFDFSKRFQRFLC